MVTKTNYIKLKYCHIFSWVHSGHCVLWRATWPIMQDQSNHCLGGLSGTIFMILLTVERHRHISPCFHSSWSCSSTPTCYSTFTSMSYKLFQHLFIILEWNLYSWNVNTLQNWLYEFTITTDLKFVRKSKSDHCYL